MENKATPEKKQLSLNANFASFKPTLKTPLAATSVSFVPTSAPKVDFSPQKEENKGKTAGLGLNSKTFDLNAPLFTPSFVPSAPAPKKKQNKKKNNNNNNNNSGEPKGEKQNEGQK